MRRPSGQRHKTWNVSTRVENALARLREGLPGGDTVPRLILVVYTAAALYNILLEYRDLRDELRHGSDHLFGIGAEYLHTVLHATAGILEDLDANQRLSAIDDHALDGLLRGKEHILLDLEGLAVIDAQGRRRAGTVSLQGTEADWFKAQAAAAQPALYVGTPVLSPDSGRPSLPVSVAIRRIGRFDGLAVALLRIDRLREPLRRLALQDKMTAVLRWQDRSLELSPPRPATGAVVALIRALPLEASPARRKTFDVNGIPFHLDGRMNEAYVVEMLVERLWVNLVLLLAPLPLSFGIVRLMRKGARDRAHMMQSLVDHMEDGMALLGRDGAVAHENEEMRHLHRLSPLLLDYDSAGRPIKLEGLFGADGPSLGEPSCSGGERHAWEVHLGDGRHMMVLLTELPDNCGILVVRDITRQVQTQAALEAHNAALEESLRKEHVLHETQRAFVSMVSHELRTPLAIIDAVAHRLHKRLTVLREERMIEGVGDIRGSVNRLTLLVDRVLSIARYDEGRLDCRPAPVDLGALLLEVCARHRALSANARFVTELNELPPSLMGDRVLLHHVFTNLVANAVKYSPDRPTVTVRGWCESGWAMVSVADNGIGIPAEELPRITERFFRASTAQGISGTGIGLYLSRQLVEMHGGCLVVRSTVGFGTTVTVRLPEVTEPVVFQEQPYPEPRQKP